MGVHWQRNGVHVLEQGLLEVKVVVGYLHEAKNHSSGGRLFY
jgi:hypothetical protein